MVAAAVPHPQAVQKEEDAAKKTDNNANDIQLDNAIASGFGGGRQDLSVTQTRKSGSIPIINDHGHGLATSRPCKVGE